MSCTAYKNHGRNYILQILRTSKAGSTCFLFVFLSLTSLQLSTTCLESDHGFWGLALREAPSKHSVDPANLPVTTFKWKTAFFFLERRVGKVTVKTGKNSSKEKEWVLRKVQGKFIGAVSATLSLPHLLHVLFFFFIGFWTPIKSSGRCSPLSLSRISKKDWKFSPYRFLSLSDWKPLPSLCYTNLSSILFSLPEKSPLKVPSTPSFSYFNL